MTWLDPRLRGPSGPRQALERELKARQAVRPVRRLIHSPQQLDPCGVATQVEVLMDIGKPLPSPLLIFQREQYFHPLIPSKRPGPLG
jgi:hypothetical protein